MVNMLETSSYAQMMRIKPIIHLMIAYSSCITWSIWNRFRLFLKIA